MVQTKILDNLIDNQEMSSLSKEALFTHASFDETYASVIMLVTSLAISIWFVTAATFHIVQLPADSYYYLRQLPASYWIGLGFTFSLLLFRKRVFSRLRTSLELGFLLLLSLYLFGLPSLSYE